MKGVDVPLKDKLIAAEHVQRARTVYIKEYAKNKALVDQLKKIFDRHEKTFRDMHFIKEDIYMFYFTRTALHITTLHKYIDKLDEKIRVYIKKYRHDMLQRKKIKIEESNT